MLTAVDFNGELRMVARKINNARTDLDLPSKVGTGDR
jgi:hypothetical protein